MKLALIVLLPFAGSLIASFLPAHARRTGAALAGLVALACTGLLASLYGEVAQAGVVRHAVPWVMGLDFSLRLDGLAWLFAALVSAMGALVVLYAHYYMSPEDPVPRFFSFFLGFMGAMLGVVLSGNLIQLVFFWELTSLVSFMLIAYWNHRIDARRGARMALIVTGSGGLAMLAGVILLGQMAGGYELDQVFAAGAAIREHPWYPAALALIALGALTKSAQFPFHFWLPHAMAAPTPVSAYLHSATMVKAGVFLLARLWPVLAGTEAWFWIIGGAGLASLVLGAYAAAFQRDMKGVLAYSTISHLGLITLLLGLNSPLALVAAVFHVVNHATFKASLFMATGIVDHETGTRDMERLGGLRHAMPLTASLALVAAAAMAGVPLLNGFLSKEMFFAETVFLDRADPSHFLLPLLAVASSMFSVAYSLRFVLKVFFGARATGLPRQPHEPPRWMLLPSALLVLACLVVGILPGWALGAPLAMAAYSMLGNDTPTYSLAVWHGVNLPLLMSAVALAGGTALYLVLQRQRATGVLFVFRLDGKRAFEWSLARLSAYAGWLVEHAASRRLQMQLLVLVLFAVGAVMLPLWQTGVPWGSLSRLPADPAFGLLWLVGGLCALGAAYQAKYHRLVALIFAGGAGLATVLTFAWFSAPDLALTQAMVEVVTTLLLLLGLRWLPRRIQAQEEGRPPERAPLRARLRRVRDFAVAICVGAGMALLSYVMLTRPVAEGLAPFFLTQSLPQGAGLNVVNVILVDFRGFDTLGEITVVGIVALTVYALLRRFRPAPESVAPPLQQREQAVPEPPDPQRALPDAYLMLPAVLIRLVLPVAVLVSIFFLLRGHNAPGGGFVGGLVLATALLVQYMFSGVIWTEARLRVLPQQWIAFGLLAAGLTGAGAWLAARPFLSALGWHGELALIGDIHLSTVLAFDLGVYMLVVGATSLILVALAHQSLRGQHLQWRRPAEGNAKRRAEEEGTS
ncbi:monovalent cation/H+ antiporter subunit A [Thauera sp. 2A1]|uniref:monovalent cation/H+ antiporter subunit A n=1 Tax=Thauera sp. 2A1 TaxID=2570191 RepID=UPI001291A46F|nr:monovalent cation/H+ antiporter subunit A [Thauera sp. 2A1]KAI5916356.1 monovalent cation/H+ antiporter subunit A [Thauera sp. 2A1]